MTITRLERLPLDKLTAGANVRVDLRLNDELVKSVKANGIIQPIVAYPDPDQPDAYRILAGHRRAAAAARAGLTDVDVIIRDTPDDVERVVEQVVENVHRDQLTDAEQATAYRQLSLDFGLPATQIAKRTGTKIARIGDAIRVAQNPIASRVLAEHQLTIDEALVFDEFADDDDALEQLTDVIETRPEQLHHHAQRIRNDRADAIARQAVVDQIIAKGITLLDQAPSYDDTNVKRLHELREEPGGWNATRIDEAIALAEAGDDLRAWPAREWERGDDGDQHQVWSIGYGVTNWRAHGWALSNSPAAKGPLTDDEKAERKLARENGKVWLAATQVRKAWVKQFLERRTLPADWGIIPALAIANTGGSFNFHTRRDTADLLAVEHPDYGKNTLLEVVTTNPAQAPHFLLAFAVAELEAIWDDKQGWKIHQPTHPLYLRQLSTWGYTLSELEEQLVTNAPAGDAE